jgi:hypothetical protein
MTKKKNTENKALAKEPPLDLMRSVQLDLFSEFLSNDLREVSNTVEYWERIPKYFISTQEQDKLRTAEGLANPYTYEYTVRDRNGIALPYKVRIQPALIEKTNGKYKAFFPTKTEEVIEEVLKKVFTEQNFGIHDPKNLESWVKFSYGMIRRELYRMGHALRYDQIKHSLEVMTKCMLTVYEDNKEIYTGAILQDYCSVDREKYLNDTDALHVARLPVFISHSINTLQYRQYNYLRFMECKEQLTRYLYKRLINRFINANYMNDYHFLYSDIKQASGLLHYKEEKDNRKKVISALNELKEREVLLSYETEERKEGQRIIDVKYTVKSSPNFISEQKAANKRALIAQEKLPKTDRLLVDK